MVECILGLLSGRRLGGRRLGGGRLGGGRLGGGRLGGLPILVIFVLHNVLSATVCMSFLKH